MDLNKKFNIKMTVLTPLSVGAGAEKDWARGVDYVQANDKVYILDIRKIIEQGIDVNAISNLFINDDENGIITLIGNKLESASKAILDSPAKTDNPIKTFIRSELVNKAIVPGSSLKGAIRSVLFTYLREQETGNKTADVFGAMKDGEDFMRFVKVTDFEMTGTKLVNTKIFNLRMDSTGSWSGGWKHETSKTTPTFSPTGFNTIYECAMPEQESYGNILLSELVFRKMIDKGSKMPYQAKKSTILSAGIRELFKIINVHTRSYLQKEKEFFQTFATDKTDKIVESIDRLLNMIPSDNSFCILKMSAGAGFHSITGDYLHDDYISGTFNRKTIHEILTQPKSRKIAINNDSFSLMGFVKLESISDSSFISSMETIQEEHESMFSAIRKDIQDKKEAIEKHKIEVETAKKEYCELITNAKELVQEKKFQEAITELEKARDLNTDLKEHIDLLDAYRKKFEQQKSENAEKVAIGQAEAAESKMQEINKQIEREKKQKFSVPFVDILGLNDNIASNISNWIKYSGKEFSNEEFNELLEFLKTKENRSLKKIFKEQKNNFKRVLPEFFDRLYREFNMR